MTNPDYAYEYHDEMTDALRTFDEVVADVQSRDEYGDTFRSPIARIIADQALREFHLGKIQALDVIDAIQTESLTDAKEHKAIEVRIKVNNAKDMLFELERADSKCAGERT